MTTPLDIIKLALKDAGVLGVGQTPLAEDLNDAFTRLNWMVSSWARKRWLVYHLIDVVAVSTGAQSYSIGPGCDFDVSVRPDKIYSAFLRQWGGGVDAQTIPTNAVDYQVRILPSREDYNRLVMKGMTPALTYYLFYDADWPQGVVCPWPAPTAGVYEMHLSIKQPIEEFTDPSQELNFPPEYKSALHYNLAERLRAAYHLPIPPGDQLAGWAKDSISVLRGANSQVPTMTMPDTLKNRRGSYNVLTDRYS